MKLRDQTKFKLKRMMLIGLLGGAIGALYMAFRNEPITLILLLQGAFVGMGVSMSLSASEIFFLRNWMKRKSFTASVLAGTGYYLTVITAVLLLSYAIFEGNKLTGFSSIQISGEPVPYIDILFSLVVSFLFVFLFQINELMGPRVLISFFTGKYHKPVEEDRIFMFLDLKSSTAIAEKIGDINFHKFINDFLFTISEAILSSKGEIYKYVGDEVIITWKMKEGLKDLHCIRLFFEALDQVKQSRNLFEKKYGAVPEFKAGIHCGKVVAGEMGDTKKEIAFLGDVINTTARIENECNLHRRPLLISGDLLQKINLEKEYQCEKIGDINLRGKMEKIELYAIARIPGGGQVAESEPSNGVTQPPKS